MKGKKNDFSMTFFENNKLVIYMEFVHDTDKAIKWIETVAKKGWSEANIYNRRTREFIEKIKK